MFRNQRRNHLQRNVADRVAVLVVDALEKVEVHHGAGKWGLMTFGRSQLALELFEEGASIQEAREPVRASLLLQLGQQLSFVDVRLVGLPPIEFWRRRRRDQTAW